MAIWQYAYAADTHALSAAARGGKGAAHAPAWKPQSRVSLKVSAEEQCDTAVQDGAAWGAAAAASGVLPREVEAAAVDLAAIAVVPKKGKSTRST